MEYRDRESQALDLTRFVFDTNSLTLELRVCYLRIVHEAFQIRETHESLSNSPRR
jgi:hypothetical protein